MSILDRFRLESKISLVTAGAGPLFGSSITEALAEAGATVITASRSLERNLAYVKTLRDKGYDAHALQMDLASPESILKLHDDVQQQFGRLDVLVNSALARPPHMGPLEETTLESLHLSAGADMVGFIMICQAFIPGMAEQGSGSIINISSIYGMVGNDPTLYVDTDIKPPAVYPFLKGGLLNFSRAMAAWYGKKGVRVNVISPGGYMQEPKEPFYSRYAERCPMGRMMNHQDIQGAVVFLASDASQYVTGCNLVVDGGWTCI
jgi:NAD(P)-dependent dehydrogenase (short-subunit alcohol dehydrogenase family)